MRRFLILTLSLSKLLILNLFCSVYCLPPSRPNARAVKAKKPSRFTSAAAKRRRADHGRANERLSYLHRFR